MNNTIGFFVSDYKRSLKAGLWFFGALAAYGAGAFLHGELEIRSIARLAELIMQGLVVAAVLCFAARLLLWYFYLKIEEKTSFRDLVAGPFSQERYIYFVTDLSRKIRGKR
jgi:NhaP-type Na+/H+ or K+/H+ antiporter